MVRKSVAGHPHGRVPRAVREQQLLDVAERLFIERGFADTSIEDICRTAGVTRPIVYEHFGSKEGVFLGCLRRIRADFETDIVSAAALSADLRTQIESVADVFFAILEKTPQRWSLVYGGAGMLLGPLADQLAEQRFGTVERIADVLRPHAPDADPERILAFAHMLSGAGEQLGRWWLHHLDVPRERVVTHLVELAWNGLRELGTSPDGRD
jgi:AcrR family transcriptional regulator